MNGWRRVPTADGSPTFVHPGHGEACHSDSGAWTEACQRYARACRLAERSRPGAVVRVLDVGTGLGLNIAAALAAVEGAEASLELVTMESDLEVVRAALEAFGDGSHPAAPSSDLPADLEVAWRPVRRALALALEAEPVLPAQGVPLGRLGRLRLLLGDARRTLDALPARPAFDAVFLDPFSPRVAPELWQPDFLARVARRMAPGSLLSTFSVSLAVRAGLVAAGLRVGPGPRVGRKAAGTLASPDGIVPPLDPRTRRRLERRVAALAGPSTSGPGAVRGGTPKTP